MSGRPAGPVVRLTLLLALLWVAIYLATECLARPWTIQGNSMEPALWPGDRVLVDLWTYRHRQPRPGEVIVFAQLGAGGAALVKRVALPPGARRSDPGLVWVLGDNAAVSSDSRVFGEVPCHRVIGRVVLRYWPPSRFSGIDGSTVGSRPPSR
jgi:signal peptidase I